MSKVYCLMTRFFFFVFFLGEHLTETELIEHLMTLLGFVANPEREGSYVDSPENVLLNEISGLISAQEFVEDIVGLST